MAKKAIGNKLFQEMTKKKLTFPNYMVEKEFGAFGSGAPAGDIRGQQSLSPPCRGSVYFRLIWKWMNQRRRRTRPRSRLRFIIGYLLVAHTAFMVPWRQAAQGHTPDLHLDPPLKNGMFVENSLWD